MFQGIDKRPRSALTEESVATRALQEAVRAEPPFSLEGSVTAPARHPSAPLLYGRVETNVSLIQIRTVEFDQEVKIRSVLCFCFYVESSRGAEIERDQRSVLVWESRVQI